MKDIIEVKSRIDGNFKTIDLTCIQDNNLSWRAKGIHTYMISRPIGWKIRKTDLVNKSLEGRDAVVKALNELRKFNYLYLVHKRNLSGQIVGSVYYVLQKPEADFKKLEKELNLEVEFNYKYVVLENKNSRKTEKPVNGDPVKLRSRKQADQDA